MTKCVIKLIMRYSIPHFTGYVIISQYADLSQTILVKDAPGLKKRLTRLPRSDCVAAIGEQSIS